MYWYIGLVVASFVWLFWATIPFRRSHALVLMDLAPDDTWLEGILELFTDDSELEKLQGMDYFWAAAMYIVYLFMGWILFLLSWLLWFIPLIIVCAIPIVKLIKNKRLKQ